MLRFTAVRLLVPTTTPSSALRGVGGSCQQMESSLTVFCAVPGVVGADKP